MTENSNRRHQLLNRTNLALQNQVPHQELGPRHPPQSIRLYNHRVVAFRCACENSLPCELSIMPPLIPAAVENSLFSYTLRSKHSLSRQEASWRQ